MASMNAKAGARRFGLAWPIAAIVVATLALWSCRAQAAECDICGRHEFSALAFRVEYADGGTIHTCCPRCASHAVAAHPDRAIARLIAHDFATGEELDARKAIYLDGSDYEHCKAPKEERTTPASATMLAYDRCLPSLMAFATMSEAEAFAHDHGGRIRTFDQIGFGSR